MTAVAYYLIKVLICSGILFLYYHIALRNKLFHQWNRFYLLFAVVGSIVLPLLQVTFQLGQAEPGGAIRLVKTVQSADEMLEEIVVVGYRSPSPEQWFSILYGAVSLFLLVGFLLSLRKIFAIIRKHGVTNFDKIRFVNTRVDGTPFSFLNYIVWNRDISLQTSIGRQIFQHELVHVQERHTHDKLLLQVVLVLFWCNPFFWLIRKELRFIHEFIADEKAVAEHGTAAFAAMILQTAYPQQFSTLTNPFFQSPIKRRLAMLTKLKHPKLSYFSRLIALPVIALTAFAFTLRVKPVATAVLDHDFIVVIDAGHGKTPAGAFSGAQVGNVYEDQVVLALAKKVQALNTNNRMKIILSRPSDAVVDLKERVAVAASEKADLFLSLHMNATEPGATAQRTSGVEVFLASKPTAFQHQSEVIGSALQQQLKTVYTTYPLLLQANAWVLNQNVCPAVLVQAGYVTNQQDRDFMGSETNQAAMAEKILMAINQYAASVKKATGLLPLRDTVPNPGKKVVSIDVKKEAKTLTLHYEDGTKETLTQEQAEKRKLLTNGKKQDPSIVVKPRTNEPKPLYVVDGTEYTGDVNALDPNTISEINVLKDQSAIDKYGTKGKNGVVEIVLKKSKQGPVTLNDGEQQTDVDKKKDDRVEEATGSVFTGTTEANEPIFEQTEKTATVDKVQWRAFLEKNLTPIIARAAGKGAKPGTYTVNVRFLVRKDGHLTDFSALNNPYDLGKELVAILPNSPKWNPAEQNGKLVHSYHIQPVTFVIQEQ